ncbi:primosomal protein N' [Lactobacillus helveticus]|uniref:Replication restart protein PriA n=1 Tax=Lactobacillus helveticus TaxID=1587 RepID=A0A3Q8SSX0_LACHE|nr:primosomal protein N' [Lactobacillus helveticus]AFR21792.1 primosomal replication factor [Lactobacillus helveticus R0052]AZK90393.1 Primosomal protein N' [Lactobacillus helveticus]MCJ2190004.1 primosomal protein N' [Lactobacillus helveticus]MED7628067.1 primosomal protein N' [Lactobacillus helveticus]MZR05601.1 primosomal protein N' [Lactobacillus helveticus]
MIAQVIVDVAAKQTDRIFEYHIPAELEKDVKIGSRVIVPFGRRKVQGFVVGIEEKSQFKGKLKDLLVKVDEMPPLTPELIKLSENLAQNIFSYRITILQAMLPWVMRAGYRKLLVPANEKAKQIPFFQGDPVDLSKMTDLKQIKKAHQLLKSDNAKIEYVVENRAKEKKENQYELTLDSAEYTKIYNTLRQNAVKQKQLIMDIIENKDDYPKSQSSLIKGLGLSTASLNSAVEKGWLKRKAVEVYRNPLAGFEDEEKPVPVTLNDEQQTALNQINKAIDQHKAETFLLEGITGSGKTEVYLHAIGQALAQGRNALMLVPEISLTPQMVKQVKARFGDKVAVLHSALSEGEKYDEWRRIRRGEIQVVVGARSAVFVPLDNIGLIVIDEEHESSYKQETNPRYNAKNVAIWRSKYHHCPLVLGSATPSLGSRARAQKDIYHLLRLTKRANHKKLPKVNLIDLKHVQFAGGQFDLSVELVDAIKKRLEKKEQVILMLNRRGFANFMLCRECGFVLKCPNCDVSLNLHKDTNSMQCHYCGHTEPIPTRCPNCQSSKIRFLGTGTQKVQEELDELLPGARILRMDVDTTRRKGSYKRILDLFGNHEADILLGTQMIAKGLDFPNVTLVGVINADTGLWLSDYNASEKTFELLTQVAGRAGRADKEGEVLIQTYSPEHYAIQLAQTQDYERFYGYEMHMRYVGNYPPYFYTVLISVAAKKEQNAAREAFKIKRYLLQHLNNQVIILGPSPSAISRVKNQYYYQILVKYKKEPNLNKLLHHVQDSAQEAKKYGLSIFIDNEPERIM